MERWKIVAEIELGIEIMGLIKNKWELGGIGFEVRREKLKL